MKNSRGQLMEKILALDDSGSVRPPRSYDMQDIIRETRTNPERASEYILEDMMNEQDVADDMDDDSEDEIDPLDGGSSNKKRGRGPALPWDKWGEEMKIIEWNKNSEPVGKYASKLMTQLGTFARNGIWFPLTITSWDGVDQNRVEEIWRSVKASTNAPDGFKRHMKKALNLSWKARKNRIKKRYYDGKTNEERLAKVPKGVQPDQWPILVAYWNLPCVQELAKGNAENRKSHYAYPRIGRNTISNIINERTKKNLRVDKLSLWTATRNKKGKFDEKDGASGIAEAIERELEALTEEERETPEKRDEIFNNLLVQGRQGVTLCQGVLASKSSFRVSSSKRMYEVELEELRARGEEESKAWAEEYERQKQKQEAQIAQMKEEHNEQIAEMKSQLEDQRKVTLQLLNVMKNAGFSITSPLLSDPKPKLVIAHESNSGILYTHLDEKENHAQNRKNNTCMVVKNAGLSPSMALFSDPSPKLVTAPESKSGVDSCNLDGKENHSPNRENDPDIVMKTIGNSIPRVLTDSKAKASHESNSGVRFTNLDGKQNHSSNGGNNQDMVMKNDGLSTSRALLKPKLETAQSDSTVVCSKLDGKENHPPNMVKPQSRERLLDKLPSLFDKVLYLFQSCERRVQSKKVILHALCQPMDLVVVRFLR